MRRAWFLPWERRNSADNFVYAVGSFSGERLPICRNRRDANMSLKGLKAWFGRGAAEDDEDETMVRDPNV